MLRSLKDLERYKVSASDGELGHVVKFLLDDEHWTLRYLVVDTGGFMGGKKVLISPISFGAIDWYGRRFHVNLTKDRVKNGPSIDLDRPVCRQHELDYQSYYGYPRYWGSTGSWGPGAFPGALSGRHADEQPLSGAPGAVPTPVDDVHLRSVNELVGYHLHGLDEPVGHIDDFIVDDASWSLPYLVVNTSDWWVGHKVLIPPQWASRVSWGERTVHLDLSREVIKASPIWDPAAPVNRTYEERLYDFYGRPVYWGAGPQPTVPLPAGATAGHAGHAGHA